MIAALFVQPGGAYFGLPDVDPWDEARDARRYAGPFPVVAHPPCGRWCRLAGFVEWRTGKKRGDDGGCFASALASVRRWGGVLEHPAYSLAWRAHGLLAPPNGGGWVRDLEGGWTCYVEQGAYGCEARKPTWLYAFGVVPPSLRWGFTDRRAAGKIVGRLRWKTARSGARVRSTPRNVVNYESRFRDSRAASRTVPAFRDALLAMAGSRLLSEAACL